MGKSTKGYTFITLNLAKFGSWMQLYIYIYVYIQGSNLRTQKEVFANEINHVGQFFIVFLLKTFPTYRGKQT